MPSLSHKGAVSSPERILLKAARYSEWREESCFNQKLVIWSGPGLLKLLDLFNLVLNSSSVIGLSSIVGLSFRVSSTVCIHTAASLWSLWSS